jgi:RNA polymerase sigma factor (sigma-70 family)
VEALRQGLFLAFLQCRDLLRLLRCSCISKDLPPAVVNTDDPPSSSGRFPQTRWTIIMQAKGQDSRAFQALNEVCTLYWPPVYAFVRRKGKSAADAEDITQGFFANLLSRGSLNAVSEDKGRLRTFLLTAVTRYLINEHEKAGAIKRGSGVALLSLDFERAERGFVAEPAHQVTPEREFERQWALQLLSHAFEEVRRDSRCNENEGLFDDLKGIISLDSNTASYEEIAARRGLSEGAVKAAAHRLRRKFRSALRAAIADTLTASDGEVEGEIEDEVQYLFSVFRTP